MIEKKLTICIIDDNPLDREVFKRYLLQDTDYTYTFLEEETGEQGLKLCRATQPDCVLLDYYLPDGSGLDFLSALTDEDGTLPFAVIILAGIDHETVALEAMKRGAQDYLVKDEMTAGSLFRAIHQAAERLAMRRTLEQQRRDLEQKNQSLQAFAYALAHDLRAPLRAINGFAQIILQDYAPTLQADLAHYVENIVRSGQQMDQLINDLLQYTRIEHQPSRARPVELAMILQRVREELSDRLTATRATLCLPPDLPCVYGDPTLLHQIFVNLIDNALTYQRPGTKPAIIIDWQAEQRAAVVNVRDNGIGIATKHYEKVFHIFQRLHGEEDYPGTGIGLAIVKKAVETMGGTVWITSEPDVGSTFSVKLPTTFQAIF